MLNVIKTRIPKHIPLVTHNLSKCDSYLFLRELVPDNGIFDSLESFTSFYKTIIVNETHTKCVSSTHSVLWLHRQISFLKA